MVNAHVRRLRGDGSRLYVFRVMVTNKSDRPNSLKEIHLVIEHLRSQGPPSNVAVPHNPNLAAYLAGSAPEILRVPYPIPGRGVVGGVAVFKVPGEILSESRVESYTLRVTDSYSRPTELEAILLREYGDDEPVEKSADSALQGPPAMIDKKPHRRRGPRPRTGEATSGG